MTSMEDAAEASPMDVLRKLLNSPDDRPPRIQLVTSMGGRHTVRVHAFAELDDAEADLVRRLMSAGLDGQGA